MKKLILILLAAVAVISVSSIAFSEQAMSQNKVAVYYFHGTFRCSLCTMMEKYFREAVETNFKDVFTSGKLEFKTVNVEGRGNEHFVHDYQLYTKSLILSLVKDGKEVKSKNLDKIWEHVRNKQKFIDYVVGEINRFLKDVQ
ncbi:MAG: nitrophenyl compound nitroreductase subunit ArsF family protein [Candidatus Omnitrophota bacterium]